MNLSPLSYNSLHRDMSIQREMSRRTDDGQRRYSQVRFETQHAAAFGFQELKIAAKGRIESLCTDQESIRLPAVADGNPRTLGNSILCDTCRVHD